MKVVNSLSIVFTSLSIFHVAFSLRSILRPPQNKILGTDKNISQATAVTFDVDPEIPNLETNCDVCAKGVLNQEQLVEYAQTFHSDPKNKLAQRAITNQGLFEVAMDLNMSTDEYFTFSNEINMLGGARDQRESGRCWLFAALSILEESVMKRFKFSASYPFFYHKLENANAFLQKMIELPGEPEERLLSKLLMEPESDGGTWNVMVALIDKYGLVPNDVFPESDSTKYSNHMNLVLDSKLREFAFKLRSLPVEERQVAKDEMMSEIYRILVISLGEPPKIFDWTLTDTEDNTITLKGWTPKEFVEAFVEMPWKSSIVLMNDPRKDFNQLYAVQHSQNVLPHPGEMFINVSMDDLKGYVLEMIMKGKPVWFGCDMNKFFSRRHDILDQNIFDFNLVLSADVLPSMSKGDQLRYHNLDSTHAMLITGVHLDEDGKPIRWKVLNSWGDEGHDGYISMSDDWFNEFALEAVIEAELVDEQLKILWSTGPAIPVPFWESMSPKCNCKYIR